MSCCSLVTLGVKLVGLFSYSEHLVTAIFIYCSQIYSAVISTLQSRLHCSYIKFIILRLQISVQNLMLRTWLLYYLEDPPPLSNVLALGSSRLQPCFRPEGPSLCHGILVVLKALGASDTRRFSEPLSCTGICYALPNGTSVRSGGRPALLLCIMDSELGQVRHRIRNLEDKIDKTEQNLAAAEQAKQQGERETTLRPAPQSQ